MTAPTEPSTVRPATASREDNLTYDLKNMAAYDISPMPAGTDLAVYSRDSVQLLVNKLFALPRNKGDEGTLVSLPSEGVFRLPRAKPIPKEKPKTRWQKFMEGLIQLCENGLTAFTTNERNMKKKKRSRLVFDEISGDWKPRWGYNSIKKSQQNANWVQEVGDRDDPSQNPFDKDKAEQRLLKARQKMREVRNKVEAAGGKLRASVPDLSNSQKRGKDGLKEAIKRAQVSSASFGKFDRVAPNEATNLQPKRKKGMAPVSGGVEKDNYLKAVGRVLSGDGPVDKHKAAQVGVSHERRNDAVSRSRVQNKRRSKQGGKGKGGKKKGRR